MAAIIVSEARWLTPGRCGTAPGEGGGGVPAPIPQPTGAAPADHRLRRRLGRKCASVLAGASMSLGLAAARIPTASAHSAAAQSVLLRSPAAQPAAAPEQAGSMPPPRAGG